jgi:hypothetical protein
MPYLKKVPLHHAGDHTGYRFFMKKVGNFLVSLPHFVLEAVKSDFFAGNANFNADVVPLANLFNGLHLKVI